MENSIQQKMRWKNKFFYLSLSCFSLMMFLQSCSIQLSPQYDVKIVDSLTENSDELLSFVEEISDGTKKVEYAEREEKYNNLIGKLESLELQVKARPIPSNKLLTKIRDKVNAALKAKGNGKLISIDDNAPSAKAIENIIKNIKVLKSDDKIKDVDDLQIKAYKGNIVLYLDQALTYEKFLNPKI